MVEWSGVATERLSRSSVVVVAKRCGNGVHGRSNWPRRFWSYCCRTLNFLLISSTNPATQTQSFKLYILKYLHHNASTGFPQSSANCFGASICETSPYCRSISCLLRRPKEPIPPCYLVSNNAMLLSSCWTIKGRG
jgi:hypothetical protein